MPFRVCLKTPKYCLFAQKWCFRHQKSSKGGSISCGFFLETTHFWPNIQHFSGFQTDSKAIIPDLEEKSKQALESCGQGVGVSVPRSFSCSPALRAGEHR